VPSTTSHQDRPYPAVPWNKKCPTQLPTTFRSHPTAPWSKWCPPQFSASIRSWPLTSWNKGFPTQLPTTSHCKRCPTKLPTTGCLTPPIRGGKRCPTQLPNPTASWIKWVPATVFRHNWVLPPYPMEQRVPKEQRVPSTTSHHKCSYPTAP